MLQQEVDDAIAARKISSAIIRSTEGKELPYLQAIASGVWTVLEAGTPEGDVIHGTFVPGGTPIGSSPFSIHHSKKTFGEDASNFRPERWLEETDADRLALMTSTVDIVFHYGKYQCLGKPVAFMEFNKLFVEASNCLQ
ncbi:hypothetical protein jhhlp_008263 [Lomentospora prolificans]|uniref:Cytochrome P450 n=1 Tax=Lomentospora prolificans TaxID=41688 RepID=A0A2N3MXJ2_9PEZI|nr:hypothetical protein jhhlp_008263 [Lomentospora prolificans]